MLSNHFSGLFLIFLTYFLQISFIECIVLNAIYYNNRGEFVWTDCCETHLLQQFLLIVQFIYLSVVRLTLLIISFHV